MVVVVVVVEASLDGADCGSGGGDCLGRLW